MTIFTTLVLFTAVFPLFIFFDHLKKKVVDRNPEMEFDYNDRPSQIILTFTPLSILFFTENFWINLAYLIPLYVYFQLLMTIANKKHCAIYLKTDIPMYANGGVVVTVIAYFIWFHEGVLAPEATVAQAVTKTSVVEEQSKWPYYVFASLFVLAIGSSIIERLKRIEPKGSGKVLVLMTFCNPILPLFTHFFWWGQLLSFVVFATVMSDVSKRSEISVRGGMGFALGYFYMMTLTLSIILYAILF